MHFRDGDALVAISASGNSPNVITFLEYAKSRGSTVVGLTGFDGGRLRQLSDISLHVATEKGNTDLERRYMIFDHLIGSYLFAAVQRECSIG